MTIELEHLRISEQRLYARLDGLAKIGTTPEKGVCRLALSDEDRQARDLVVDWMKELNLEVRIDQIGNIFGIRAGSESLDPVMTGSHIDTVINGGNLDGNLGVVAGLEIVETLNVHSVQTKRPFIVGVFTNEKARFHPI